ncbi:MAG: cytochrome b [Xanthomonadales bacterium]|nr:cytochrome b [Xanthomonadales bacterium]
MIPKHRTRTRYDLLQISLHWATLILIAWLAWLGLTMTDLPLSPEKVRTYALHKSLGLTVLGLTALRLLWRGIARTPPALPGPRWQLLAAKFGHLGLYLLLLAVPLSGWLYNSASNFPLQWFGLFNLPALVDGDKALKATALTIHETLFWTLIALITVHAAAALWHHHAKRDDTLRRMLPGRMR